jgi:hypothetical protein
MYNANKYHVNYYQDIFPGRLLYMVLGIDDPQIWLAYLACVFSALGCMVYGLLNWREGKDEQTVKSSTQKQVTQDQ